MELAHGSGAARLWRRDGAGVCCGGVAGDRDGRKANGKAGSAKEMSCFNGRKSSMKVGKREKVGTRKPKKAKQELGT